MTVAVKDENNNDSTLINFIKNTVKEYTKEQLETFYEGEEERKS